MVQTSSPSFPIRRSPSPRPSALPSLERSSPPESEPAENENAVGVADQALFMAILDLDGDIVAEFRTTVAVAICDQTRCKRRGETFADERKVLIRLAVLNPQVDLS